MVVFSVQLYNSLILDDTALIIYSHYGLAVKLFCGYLQLNFSSGSLVIQAHDYYGLAVKIFQQVFVVKLNLLSYTAYRIVVLP